MGVVADFNVLFRGNKQMNITLCVKQFIGGGGQEIVLRRLARFLVSCGHNVKVLTIKGEPLDGVLLQMVSAPAMVPRFARDWVLGRALAREMIADRSDVSMGEQKTWGCSVVRPGGGVEACYWRRRMFEPGGIVNLPAFLPSSLLKMVFDLMAEWRSYNTPGLKRVITNSQMVRDALLARFSHLSDMVDVVYNGADIERFKPENAGRWRRQVAGELGFGERDLTGIFVANNFALKGLKQAIETIFTARNKGGLQSLRLLVVGRGRDRSYVRLVRSMGLSDNIRFAGGSDVPERYYSAADFLLLPTFYDPCANVTLEALASGLPVITTRMNGACELMDDRHGCVVDHPDDIKGMADFILSCNDKIVLDKMKVAARELAEKHSLDSKFAAIEEILKESAVIRG